MQSVSNNANSRCNNASHDQLDARHGILLIFDEMITGFGCMTTRFAFDDFGVAPDMVTTTKGLTSGVAAMGAGFVKQAIHDAMNAFKRAFAERILIRVTDDIIALSPSLILEKKHIDELFGKLAEILNTLV